MVRTREISYSWGRVRKWGPVVDIKIIGAGSEAVKGDDAKGGGLNGGEGGSGQGGRKGGGSLGAD